VVGCRRLEDIEMGVIDYRRQKVAKIEMDGRRMETCREALEGGWSWQAQWCARTRHLKIGVGQRALKVLCFYDV
jgi:hypothetical protein